MTANTTDPARPLATMREAAEYLGVSERTLRRWIAAGIIHAERFGPRLIRVNLNSVQGRPLQYNDEADQR